MEPAGKGLLWPGRKVPEQAGVGLKAGEGGTVVLSHSPPTPRQAEALPPRGTSVRQLCRGGKARDLTHLRSPHWAGHSPAARASVWGHVLYLWDDGGPSAHWACGLTLPPWPCNLGHPLPLGSCPCLPHGWPSGGLRWGLRQASASIQSAGLSPRRGSHPLPSSPLSGPNVKRAFLGARRESRE